MRLDKLPKTTSKKKKRLGRGYGSGKGGHTSGRGQKGQKARSKVGLLFEGTKTRKSLIRRMPMLRGKSKLTSHSKQPVVLNLTDLSKLKGDLVTVEKLVRIGLVNERETRRSGIKLLGKGEVKKELQVAIPVSKNAQKKIKQAGGEVVDSASLKKDKETKTEPTKSKA